ncbi:Mob1/phocein [Parasitella parasitica]|nr:Mob1/phocein [Parasitella parasitica]
MMNFLNFSFGKKGNKTSKNKSATSSASSLATNHSGTQAHLSQQQQQQKPLYLSSLQINNMLVRGNFKTIAELPKYVDINEWLAFNTFEFFNHINLFYGTITNFCTLQTCATMSAGPGVEYTWTDSSSKKLKLPAPQYIDYMTSSLENTLNDESIFPTKAGPDFPRELPAVVKKMFTHMFSLFAHIYHVHYDTVLCLNEEPHFNSLFAHFISFAREFDLLDRKDVQPLNELIEAMSKNSVIC